MSPAKSIGSVATFGLAVGAVWLAWQIAKAPIIDRAPVSLAVRMAPRSPEVLRRAAEEELVAGRIDNAKALAEESLKGAPFSARTLRILGLATARAGQVDQADAMITLAGNWSLRDDPAHAWLVEHRLRRGDYESAFAHADTLARRWVDGNERIYNLFASAVLADQRALPAVARAVARKPPWRSAFVLYLLDRPDGDAVLLALGLALGTRSDGYTAQELSWIYQSWYDEGRLEAIRVLRTEIGRPAGLEAIQNGDFSDPRDAALMPFGWRLAPSPGISADFLEDDVRSDEIALRVEHDGYASGVVAQQVLMLRPGRWRMSGQQRSETAPDPTRLRWTLSCATTNLPIGSSAVAAGAADWIGFAIDFTVPAACPMQRLRLETDPGSRRTTIVTWFDKLGVAPITSAGTEG